MEITGTFFFDPADPIYRDHFPEMPVVPGTQIIRAFMEAGGRVLEGKSRVVIENFRFGRFIPPGEYRYRIKRLCDALVCELFDGDRKVAGGRLKI